MDEVGTFGAQLHVRLFTAKKRPDLIHPVVPNRRSAHTIVLDYSCLNTPMHELAPENRNPTHEKKKIMSALNSYF